MENKFSKMMFAFVAALALSVSTVSATWVNVQVTPGSWAGEISWSLIDASGTSIASTTPGTYSFSGIAIDNWVNATDGCYEMELYDSFGDGWNGGVYQIIDSAGTIYSSGGMAGGSFAMYPTSINGTCTLGCTDPTATNYNPAAIWDDGTCTYPCVAADTTNSLETGFVHWTNDAANTLDWTIWSGGTSSGSTGPSAAFDGVNYAYTETSGAGSNKTATLNAVCIDMSGWTSPAFVMAYHMYGAAMGTLNVDVSTDGGTTWTNEWTLTGNQGDQWSQAVVDLSAYAGQVSVRIQGLTGTSFTSDMAVDYLQFMEMPILGCTDPFASNYNAAAVIDDGSCLYPGCLDPLASNYCATCNLNDSLSCVYPACNALDFSDDFELANLSGNGWTTLSGSESSVSLTTANAIGDTVSVEMSGGANTSTWTYSPLASVAFANTEHIASTTICLDMSGAAAIVNLTLDLEIETYYPTSYYAWFRVRAYGATTGIADVNGNSYHNGNTLTGVNTLTYDLSAYSGQSQVYLVFESAVRTGTAYSTIVTDNVRIDNINVFSVYPCTYYAASSVVDNDVTCNGGADGSATASVSSPNATTDTYLWSDGQTTATATGLIAGTYTCTTTDAINGCTSTTSVTVTEPMAYAFTALVTDVTSPISTLGSVDLSVSGATPCITNTDLFVSVAGGNGQNGNAFNVINTSGGDLTISGFSQGPGYPNVSEAGVSMEVFCAYGDYTVGTPTWTSVATAVVDLTTSLTTGYVAIPGGISIPAGGTYGFWVGRSDGGTVQYTNGAGTPGVSPWASDAFVTVTEGHGGTYPTGLNFSPRNWNGTVHYGDPSASAYTFAWSTGDTTEDVSGLGMGPVSCTVTDCNGCTDVWSGFIMVNIVDGCMDPLAINYNPIANNDDGSCLYPGCTDSLAMNFDPTANLNDSTCTYSCSYLGYDDVISVSFESDFWASESSWYVISFSGDTVLTSTPYSGSFITDTSSGCAMNECYYFVMVDAFGDGGGISTVTSSNGDTLGIFTCQGSGNTGTFGLGQVCITGCMDVSATNYDPNATISDSTLCIYCPGNLVELTMIDSWGDGWNGAAFVISDAVTGFNAGIATLSTGFIGTEFICLADGCYNIDVTGGFYPGEVSFLLQDSNGDTLAYANAPSGVPYSGNLNLNGTCVSACMDVAACNYDSTATFDDGSCDYSCIGCSDPLAYNYGGTGITIDDGSCLICAATASAVGFDAYDSTSTSGSVDLTVAGSNCSIGDTVIAGPHGSDYTSTFTRGYYFQAQSSFNIMGVHASDGNTSGAAATSQSVEIVDFGTIMPAAYPGPGSAYTILFSAIDAGSGWLATGNVSIVAGNYYGVIGAKHDAGSTTMYNSYLPSPSITIDGNATQLNRIVLQGSLAAGSPASGMYMAEAPGSGSIGRTDFITGTPGINASYLWSNGDTTEDLSAVAYGTYSVNGVDCNGCAFSASAYVGVTPLPGCTDPLAFNYDSLANFDDGSCIAVVDGCTDTSAANYDPLANTNDGTCHFCFGSNSVTIDVSTNPWPYEVSWNLLDANGTLVLSGGAPFTLDTCLADGCYSIDMFDSFGDGWNGSIFSITENVSGVSVSAGLASGSTGSASLSSAAIGCYLYGCTDVLATNYDPTANTDDGSCSYAMCVTAYPFSEDFETGTSSYLTLFDGGNATSSIDSSNGQAVWSWQGQGGTSAGWLSPYGTGADAFATNPTHVATGAVCVDLTSFAVGSTVAMSFDLRQEFSFNSTYSWFRVMSDSTLLTSTAGNDYYSASNACLDPWVNHTYDLSAYAGSSINIMFQSAGKYDDDYYQCGDNSYVDNISIVSAIYGCMDPLATNFNPAATADDGSCVYPCHTATGYSAGFEDGIASLNLTPADWTQNSDDNSNGSSSYGDWIWDAFGTGSSLTGPNYSTNYGGTGYAMEGAYYMYVEASGNYNNDISMTSHCFDLSTLSNAQLNFWYNMYGSGMGSLDVELSSDGGMTWDSTWTVSGDQGVDWAQANIDVSAYAATGVTVKITGTTGTTYYSDICIDAMSFVDASQVYGCTDSTAWNYDATATIDDGSCQYPCLDNEVTFEMFDSWGDGWNGSTYDVSIGGVSVATGGLTSGSAGTDTLCLPTGCYDVTVGGGSFLNEVSFNFGTLVGSPVGSYTGVSIGGASCGPILGCTDSTATNYDPTATVDDGSCTYCTGTFANINVGGGSYLSEVSWTLLNSSGGIVLTGGAPFSLDTCLADDCYTVDMLDSYGDGWNGSTFNLDGVALGGLLSGSAGSFTFSTGSASCAITGCTDMLASNYDPTATVDDGSCTYPCLDNVVVFNGYDSWGDGWNGGTYDVTSNGTSVASGGLTSGSSFADTLCLPTGCYDVTVGGGFYDNEISFDFASLVGSAAGTYTDISVGGAICGVVVVNGCTDSTALNYDPTATVDDGSCVYCVYGCTDSTAVNYAALATCDDGSCIASVYGCTDATACNYYAGANVDDGSCEWTSCNPTTCGASPITGLGVTNVVHNRVTLTFDNMNTYDALGAQLCRVDQLRIKYREVGTSTWSQKNMAAPTGYDPTTGICNSTQNTDKLVLGLTGSTTYEWEMRVWYCATGATAWVVGPNFTTAINCPDAGNLAVTSGSSTQATFTWDDSNGAYSFVRLQAKVDATGTSFFNIGGIGVNYGTFTKNKNGLVPGESYRAKSRTWCDPNGGAYKALSWTSFIYWTQPTSIRLEGGSAINNLAVYPNPSRDVFNVTFTSEDVQNLEVRVLNVVGEVVYTENLEQFVGEYTKAIDLATYTKGVYFLEITTNTGVVNKKLILQ